MFDVSTSGYYAYLPRPESKRKTDRPNQVWVSDITYLPSRAGWLYLVVFIDLFSRRVVGWNVSPFLGHESILKALSRAIWKRRPKPGLMIHSDRGVQYCCEGFRKAIHTHKFSKV